MYILHQTLQIKKVPEKEVWKHNMTAKHNNYLLEQVVQSSAHSDTVAGNHEDGQHLGLVSPWDIYLWRCFHHLVQLLHLFKNIQALQGN